MLAVSGIFGRDDRHLLLELVAVDTTLQVPMYQLWGLLAAADLIVATSTVPKA